VTAGRRRLLQAASIGALVALWEIAARARWVDPLFVPAPSAIVRAFGVIGPEAVRLLGETLGKALAAYVLAVLLGVGAGLLIGSLRYIHDVLARSLVALYARPRSWVLP
jgi:ABC-type nitrate/sulfonate/bicarbonate transport system permease component